MTANPGPDFPRAWTSRFQIELEGRVSHTAPTKFGLVKLEVQESFKKGLLTERQGLKMTIISLIIRRIIGITCLVNFKEVIIW